MSIKNAYDPMGEPLLTPDKFYEKHPKITDVAVACFSRDALNHVLENHRHELYLDLRATANGPIAFYYLPDFHVLFFMSPIGASVAAGLLHEVAYFAGIEHFVYFGSCGVLDDSLRGKFIAPTSCYREEGFSYHYAPETEYMDIENHALVGEFIRGLGYPCVEGKGWTTDAIYNETKTKVAARKKEGVICVDMESSALQAIANHLGVSLYTFYFAGDVLGEVWQSGDLGGLNKNPRLQGAVFRPGL